MQDPGNLEGDLQAGTTAGYTLCWVLMWSTAMVCSPLCKPISLSVLAMTVQQALLCSQLPLHALDLSCEARQAGCTLSVQIAPVVSLQSSSVFYSELWHGIWCCHCTQDVESAWGGCALWQLCGCGACAEPQCVLPRYTCRHHASALRVRLPRQQVVAGGSFMNFRNDMALGGNLATQFAATPETQARSLCARVHKRCS